MWDLEPIFKLHHHSLSLSLYTYSKKSKEASFQSSWPSPLRVIWSWSVVEKRGCKSVERESRADKANRAGLAKQAWAGQKRADINRDCVEGKKKSGFVAQRET